MADGISPNPLNDISKAYLEVVAKINKDEEEKIIQILRCQRLLLEERSRHQLNLKN